MEILAQFFWYMALGLMPQAFPLAILLSSLITYGNLGESSELTAIKAAGISLMQSMRSLILAVFLIAGISFYFQNVVVPSANMQLKQLLVSMKQKSPELEIPEGTFYDGIPNSNLYVEKKDLKTGHLYGIMIYRQTGSYEDQTIILADSGMLQSTAEKKHLLLTLWSGEWFENMRSQDMGGTAEVPYRRETFGQKQIVLDFDGDFNLADASNFAGDASSKSVPRLLHDLDSIKLSNDSVGRQFYHEAKNYTFRTEELTTQDSTRLLSVTEADLPVLDGGPTGSERRERPGDEKRLRLELKPHRATAPAGSPRQVHTGPFLYHLLLYWCTTGRHHPQRRIRRTRHRIGHRVSDFLPARHDWYAYGT